VQDHVRLRLDLDVAIGFDLDELVDRIEDDLVLLRLVDNGDLLSAVLVIEDDPVTTPRLDELGVVLAGLVGLYRFLLPAPQRTDDDRPIDVAVFLNKFRRAAESLP